MWITIIIALLLSLAALLWVLWPLFSAKVKPYHTEDEDLIELIVRKDGIMVAIKDLEFDHQVGKISEEDYQRFDARLRRQAIAYMQQIEKRSPQIAKIEDALEAEISRQRRTLNGRNQPAPKPTTITGTATTSLRFCTNCGESLSPNHKFCANCGTPVSSMIATTG
jgi:hypothetical protein